MSENEIKACRCILLRSFYRSQTRILKTYIPMKMIHGLRLGKKKKKGELPRVNTEISQIIVEI